MKCLAWVLSAVLLAGCGGREPRESAAADGAADAAAPAAAAPAPSAAPVRPGQRLTRDLRAQQQEARARAAEVDGIGDRGR